MRNSPTITDHADCGKPKAKMKADIQSQIKFIDAKIMYHKINRIPYSMGRKHLERKAFLIHTLNAPCHEVNEIALNFVYGK